MTADNGMDGTGTDWQARAEAAERRARQLEHSNLVLTEHVDVLRRRMDDRLTVWDHYAAAALGAIANVVADSAEAWDTCIPYAVEHTARMADAMMAERARRARE